MSRKRGKAEKRYTLILSSALIKEVQDRYHRRVAKLMNHNLEKKRIWKSRDFSECQVEGSFCS